VFHLRPEAQDSAHPREAFEILRRVAARPSSLVLARMASTSVKSSFQSNLGCREERGALCRVTVPPTPIHSGSGPKTSGKRQRHLERLPSMRHLRPSDLPVQPPQTTFLPSGIPMPGKRLERLSPGRAPSSIGPNARRSFRPSLSSAPPEDQGGPRLPCRARMSSKSSCAWSPSTPAPRTSRSVLLRARSQTPPFRTPRRQARHRISPRQEESFPD